MQWRVGTSGWFYRHWRGRFYPAGMPPRDWLAYYARHFTTTEINRSFYRLPERQQFARWAAVVAATPDFRFAVKASRVITHVRRLTDCAEPLQQLAMAAEGLGSTRGPLLVQLPPSLACDLELLRSFLAVLPARWPTAFEFRHLSWYTPHVSDLLRQSGCACVVAYGGAHPTPAEWTTLGAFGYVRVHSGQFGVGLTDEEIAWLAERIASWSTHCSGFVYFNNDLGAHAVTDAQRLRERLQHEGVTVL